MCEEVRAWLCVRSVEVSEDLATDVLALGLLVVHDAVCGGQDDLAELSGGEDVVHELFEVLQLEVVARGDDTALVEATVELNDDLAASLVVNDFELIDVAVLLHHTEELDHDLGGGAEENLLLEIREGSGDYLSLASLLGVDDRSEAVSQNTHANHCSKLRGERILDTDHNKPYFSLTY